MNTRELRDYLPLITVSDGCVLSKKGDLTFGWELTLPMAFTVNEAGYDSIINTFLQAYRLLPPWCIIHKQDIYRYDTYHGGEAKGFLGQAYSRHFEGRRFLNGYCYLYLTFSTKGNVEKKNADSGFGGVFGNKSSLTEKIGECASLASQFEAVLSNNSLLVVRALKDEDFISMGSHGQDVGVIPSYLNLYARDGDPDYNLDFSPDCLRYGDNTLRCWYVEDSDAYPGVVSSVNFVQSKSSNNTKVYLSGGSPIGFSLNIPHIVNRYVLTLPRNMVEKELDQRKRLMTSFSLYSSSCHVNSQELERYLYQAALDNTTTTKCYMNVMAWCPETEMPSVRNKIVTAFNAGLGVNVVEEKHVVPLLHYAAIPGAESELGFDNYLNSEITAFLCHGLWDGYDGGMKDGALRLCDRERMVPVRLDIQSIARKNGHINNMNALVVGPSGSGKSFTMNSLVQNFYEDNQHILIVDVGDSYQGLCQVIREETGGEDGVYNTYDPEHPFGFNPFKGRNEWNKLDEDGENASSGYDFILSLLKTIYKPEKGWSNQASSILKSMLSDFLSWWDNGAPEKISEDLRDAFVNERRIRAERNHRTFDEKKELMAYQDSLKDIFRDKSGHGTDPLFDDFYQFVSRVVTPLMRDDNYYMGDVKITRDMFDADSFAASMDMYKKEGIYGYLLNATEEKDLFKSRLTVFEVDRIKDNSDLFPLWVLCIMHSFEDKMRSLSCQKVIIIEEAWKAIASPEMSGFILWLWRTARKFRTSAIVVTQDINDLTGSEIIKGAIIQNSDVRILLDQRKNANNFQRAVEVLGLSSMATNLVLSVNQELKPGYHYKEGFFAIGENYCNVFAIEVSPEQALAFETDKTLKKPVLDLARKCNGSIISAIKIMVQEKKQTKI